MLKRGPQNLKRKPSEYLRSIYMDIVSPLPEAMRFALDFSGPDKLLFASDHPWVQPKEILDPLRRLEAASKRRQRQRFSAAMHGSCSRFEVHTEVFDESCRDR